MHFSHDGDCADCTTERNIAPKKTMGLVSLTARECHGTAIRCEYCSKKKLN